MNAEIVVVSGPVNSELAGLPGISAQTWASDPRRVIRAHDDVRVRAAVVMTTAVHEALARLQSTFGRARCVLATTAIDGLLHKAGAEDILELRGSLFWLTCDTHGQAHPLIQVSGLSWPPAPCEVCGAPLRPDLALPGERHRHWTTLLAAISTAQRALWVDLDEPVAQALARAARQVPGCVTYGAGASAALADHPLEGDADAAVPALVERWVRG